MNKKHLLITLVATLISGVASGYFITNGEKYGEFAVFDSPGVLFGITTAATFYYLYKPSLVKTLVWILTSWLSWRVALSLFLTMGQELQLESFAFAQLIVPGLVGASLLGLLFWALIESSSVVKVLLTTIAGGFGAIGMFLIFNNYSKEGSEAFMYSFVVWQSAVGIALVTNNSLLTQTVAKKK